MIIAFALLVSSGCAPKHIKAGNKGLPFGTVLTIGGQKNDCC